MTLDLRFFIILPKNISRCYDLNYCNQVRVYLAKMETIRLWDKLSDCDPDFDGEPTDSQISGDARYG
jgi:hypothetical protein